MTLKELRYKKGMNQGQLAEALNVSRQTVVMMERNGLAGRSPILIHRVCDFFGVDEYDVIPLSEAIRYKPKNKQQAKKLIKMIKEKYLC